MTLAQRLLLSLSLLVILATTALGLFVQHSWREAEEAQFEREFSLAAARLAAQLDGEASELPRLLGPLCEHSQMVDEPLTLLKVGAIPQDRKHALGLLANGTALAYRLDEFLLFTSSGDVLGAHDPALIGKKDLTLALLEGGNAGASLVVEAGIPKVKAYCLKRDGERGIGLMAARYLKNTLAQVGALHGLTLALDPPADPTRHLKRLALPAFAGTSIFVSPRESWLDDAVERATRAILLWGALTLGGALLVGWLFARRLAIPMERLAEQVEHAFEGEPKPVVARGAREIVRFAEAFNHAIEDLAQLRKRLAATERIAAQREIARRVAHEIKNPLAPIRAAIETLRRLRRRNDENFDTYFEEATGTVLSEVQRITTIVNEFTEFARMPAPRPTALDLAPQVHAVVGLHRQEGIDLHAELSSDLPQVYADRDQLVQVLTNLVQNALDAVKSSAAPRVTIAAQPKGQFVEVSVKDNGPGVPEHVRDTLFQPYVTSKAHGTGLGLAIAQKIVTEHGGTLEYNGDGPGACFTFRLPLATRAS